MARTSLPHSFILLPTILLTCALAAPARPDGIYHAARYSVSWSTDRLEVRTPDGRSLLRWPVGATCHPADPESPAMAEPPRRATMPFLGREKGVPVLTWRWQFAPPWPFAEQEETYRLLPARIEVRARFRWRDAPARLVRLVYGARLAAGCWDLEGLWEAREELAGPWLPAPVPGITRRIGVLPHRRAIRVDDPSQHLELCIGGIDDGDVTRWDDVEIGRTPADPVARSWEQVRRYEFDTGARGPEHILSVDVNNVEGTGGIWRGPCVLGPANVLNAGPSRDGWTRASCEGIALHHWCPDAYAHPLTARFTVSLTSLDRTHDLVPENVTTGGRFLIPPYVVAIEGRNGWWGLGTLDLPRAEDGLRVEWRDGTFACPFLLSTQPSVRSGDWTAGPRVAILLAGSRRGVLAAYRQALPDPSALRLRDWWSGPMYCTWGDQVYTGGEGAALTPANLDRWLTAAKQGAWDLPVISLDAGWWQLPKSCIEMLHATGKHVLFWTQPHWGPTTSADLQAHPEWLVHDAASRLLRWDAGNWLLDYSAPGLRRHMAQQWASYVSATGWHADGIKLDFNYVGAPLWARMSDPAWGAGEQYRARALQTVYRAIKQVRPDALVTASCANPLWSPVEDLCRLNDDWSGDPQVLRRRADVVLSAGAWVDSDDWHAYDAYLPWQALERPVWGCMSLLSVQSREDAQQRPLPLSPEWRRRLAVLLRLAQQAPVRAGDRVRYEPEHGIARRVSATGALRVAALRLAGSTGPAQALAVAQGDRVLVAAVANGRVCVLVSRGVLRVEEIRHDGRRISIPFLRRAGGVLMDVRDAGGQVSHYEIVLRPARRMIRSGGPMRVRRNIVARSRRRWCSDHTCIGGEMR